MSIGECSPRGSAARGSALVAVLGLTALLLPLGVFAALQARMDLLIQRNVCAEIEALYVAEAGLEHAVAEIPPGTSFDAVLAGPDRVPGTPDDGGFPFSEGPPAAFPSVPLHYDVRAAQRPDGWLDVTSTAAGQNGAAKVLAAIVTRSPLPFTPAALYVGDAALADLGVGGLIVSGLDHRITDAATAPTGTAAARPALATSRAGAEPELRQRLAAAAARLVGAGESPSIAATSPPDVQALVAACAQRPGHVSVAPVIATAVLGSVDAPQIAVADDLEVTGQLTGAGVLVVRGTLHVTGSLSFTGLVVALGAIIGESSSDLRVTGALWRADSPDPRLYLDGQGAIAYSSAALATADSAFPHLLPHAAVVAGWQEVL